MISCSSEQTVGECASLRHRCTYTHIHTHIHRHPSPHPLLLWNLSPRQRYVVVMDEGDDDDDDGYEDDNGDRINNPLLNYKVQLTINERTAGLCSLQRGWKERRVILRNANRPFPHRKSDRSPGFLVHSLHVLLFKHLKSHHVELQSSLVWNNLLSSAAIPKIAHHQPSSQQTNKTCRPSYCHLSSLCDFSLVLLLRSPADLKTSIKTWQIRPLVIEEGRIDSDRARVLLGAA